MRDWLEDNSPYLPIVLSFLIASFFWFEPNLREEYWSTFFPRFVAGVLVMIIGISLTLLLRKGRQKRTRARLPRLGKYLLPFFCLILIIIHAIFPEYAIDNTTIALIIIILFPGLIPHLSKAKFPGGFEFDFREETQRLEEASKKSPEISSGIEIQLPEIMPDEMEVVPSRQDLFRSDPNLALASLRIDIEKKLKEIASHSDIPIYKKPLGAILKKLLANEIIGLNEYDILFSVINICNKAIHAERVDHSSASRVLDIGDSALVYLHSITLSWDEI